MSFTFTPALPPSESEERSQHLLDIGKKCSLPSCNLVDFLPFKCQHCAHHYCGEHFLPKAHTCEKWDERQWDRIVPNCPLCNEPVAIPPGQDPNIRMEEHISSKCSVMLGTNKSTKYSGPTCANQRCRKTLFPAIRCDTCKQHFCAAHRFSEDHTCVPPAPSTSTSPPSAKKLFSNLKLGSSSSSAARPGTNTNNKSRPGLSSAPSDVPEYLGAKAAAASAAIKRSIASAASPPPSKAPTSNGTSNGATANTKPAVHNPFSKVDRRAKAERESRRRALQERAKKGLLSEAEKAMLAQEEAQSATSNSQEGDNKKECIIM